MTGVTRCHYCGIRLETSERILDYIEPRSSGGGAKPSGIVPTCAPCITHQGLSDPSATVTT